jgi:hypothetical protein
MSTPKPILVTPIPSRALSSPFKVLLRPLSALSVVFSMFGLLALGAAPVQAAIGHEYVSQLTGFSNPAGLAVGPAGPESSAAEKDALYVADRGHRTVDRFASTGAPLAFTAKESYVSGNEITGTPIASAGGVASFNSPVAVAVNDETGDLYIADITNPEAAGTSGVVDVFSPTGEYLYQLTGTPASAAVSGPFEDPWGVTVDQSTHELYVVDLGRGVVDVFSPTGEYLSQLGAGILGQSATGGVASNDLTGATYVVHGGEHDVVDVFGSVGELIPPEWHGSSTPSGNFPGRLNVGVDPATHQVYVTYGSIAGAIDQFAASSSEEYLGRVTGTPSGPFKDLTAVAVDPSNEDLYVAEGVLPTSATNTTTTRGVVDVFGPSVVVPGPSIQPPSSFTATTATLGGVVDPAGVQVTSCEIEYGLDNPSLIPAFSQSEKCKQTPAEIGAGNGPVAITAVLKGLQPNTRYDYRLVVANANGAEVSEVLAFTTFGPPAIVSESAEVKQTEKVGQTNATLRAQIIPEGRETTYHFEYGETTSYGTSVPGPAGTVGSGYAPVQVPAAELTGLKIGTTYHYRVVAVNEFGTTDGPDQEFTTLAALLSKASVSDVAATSATLEAQINPLGTDTSAYFQYGTVSCTANPASCTDVPNPSGTDLGSAESGQTLSIHQQNLTPDTTYYFRVVATNALGTIESPDLSFKTQRLGGALALLDARQWELVTPPNKHGAVVYGYSREQPLQSAADGSGITNLLSEPPEAEPSGSSQAVQVLSTRGAAGWSTRVIALPHKEGSGVSVGAGGEFQFFSKDLSRAIVHPFGENFDPLLSPEASEQTAYLRDDTTGTYRPLVTGCPATGACPASVAEHANVPPGTIFGHFDVNNLGHTDCPPAIFCGPAFVAGSSDLSHVILLSEVQLTATAPAGEEYEWSDGRLEPLQGSLADAGSKGNREAFSRHTISSDGERLILGSDPLYLRNGAGGEMIRLDVANAGAPGVSARASYGTASSDDSHIFFLDNTGLTAESSASGLDLYEYDLNAPAGERLTDLSVDHNPGEAAGVQTVLGASEDGSYVYFAATGALTADAPHGGCPFERGQQFTEACHVYVYHDGTIRLITSNWYGESVTESGDPEFARVSPDGRWLSFMSNQDLTGYDTRDSGDGQPDQEVYLYSADTNRLACASCNPTGARPVGVTLSSQAIFGPESGEFLGHDFSGGESLASYVPSWTATSGSQTRYQPRYLSDGGRVFFNSHDALVPQDINSQWDVYEYEPAGYVNGEGVQECTEALSTYEPAHIFETGGRKDESGAGCVSLISSGTSHEESAFLDASVTGGDVFFLTSEKLLRQDYDNAYDVYDAHECTAAVPCFPVSASQPPACETEASCKASPTPQPEIFGSPASATFSGKGNLAPPPPVIAKKTAAQLKSEKLAKALRACRKKAKGKARASCEKQARAKYGPVSSRKKAKKSSNDRRASR